MKIAVIGIGYVGLTTSTCLAEMGNSVTGIDIDAAKIETLNAGELPIYEPGLETLFKRNRQQNRLHFTTDLKTEVGSAALIFLALPTPSQEDGQVDLSCIFGIAGDIGNRYR